MRMLFTTTAGMRHFHSLVPLALLLLLTIGGNAHVFCNLHA